VATLRKSFEVFFILVFFVIVVVVVVVVERGRESERQRS
jgi:t-SNARE complex subunit (syntaxin)